MKIVIEFDSNNRAHKAYIFNAQNTCIGSLKDKSDNNYHPREWRGDKLLCDYCERSYIYGNTLESALHSVEEAMEKAEVHGGAS